jgi:hypothetical protein
MEDHKLRGRTIWNTEKNTSLSTVCVFPSHLAEFEAEFDPNPLLLHISHFSKSVQSQNSTNMT